LVDGATLAEFELPRCASLLISHQIHSELLRETLAVGRNARSPCSKGQFVLEHPVWIQLWLILTKF